MILRLAISSNNFEVFKSLYNEFGGMLLVKELSIYRAITIAEFYLENNDKSAAKEIFEAILKRSPDFERAQIGLQNSL